MEARLARLALLAAIVASLGARYKTPNFVVDAPTPEFAEAVGKAAEKYRRELAVHWLGQTLPKWSQPCPISVKLMRGAGGVTSFQFDRGEVYGWRMSIQGSREQILDSVLPHEVTHTIFASHFRRPLPRWADEGACTTVEHPSEKALAEKRLIEYLKTGRGIPFSRMFAMKNYPQDVLPLYAQGYSLTAFLIDQGGESKFMEFLGEGMQHENWAAAIEQHYNYPNLGALQNSWLDWVKNGRPLKSELARNNVDSANTSATTVADGTSDEADAESSKQRRPRPEPNLIYRAQSEDPPTASHAVSGATMPGTAATPAGTTRAGATTTASETTTASATTPPANELPAGMAGQATAVSGPTATAHQHPQAHLESSRPLRQEQPQRAVPSREPRAELRPSDSAWQPAATSPNPAARETTVPKPPRNELPHDPTTPGSTLPAGKVLLEWSRTDTTVQRPVAESNTSHAARQPQSQAGASRGAQTPRAPLMDASLSSRGTLLR